MKQKVFNCDDNDVFHIKTEYLEDHKTVVNLLELYGYQIWDGSNMDTYSQRVYHYFPTISVSPLDKSIQGSPPFPKGDIYNWISNAQGVVERLTKPHSIALEGMGVYKYKATIQGESVIFREGSEVDLRTMIEIVKMMGELRSIRQ